VTAGDNRHDDVARRQYRQPRLAEMIAGELRERILSGQLADGSLLPKQEDLLDEFNVSGPSIREALRILETEGLVTVRRGNVGGAVVHRPQPVSVAYVVSLVLQSKQVGLKDVALAIQEIEPTCVALCAARPDRLDTVVPELRRISALGEEAIDDMDASMRLTEDFHRAMVEGCGNETLILIVGALEKLWAAHIQVWARRSAEQGVPSRHTRETANADHEKLVDLIELGAVDDARRFAALHLQRSVRSVVGEQDDLVRAGLIRPS
jgi:GntR family transcriptional regulator, transcriptional repressor for pyruvate dehydrogenase complex